MNKNNLYDYDFYAWTQEQANLLKNQNYNNLDLENLIEEIESMGKSNISQLENRLTILLAHLLKWKYQSHFRSNSWECTIKEQRKKIISHIVKNPSLKSSLDEIFKEAYEYAILQASRETRIATSQFPEQSPFTYQQTINDVFWPSEENIF